MAELDKPADEKKIEAKITFFCSRIINLSFNGLAYNSSEHFTNCWRHSHRWNQDVSEHSYQKIEANCKITFCSGIINLLFDGLVYNTIIECNLCALKKPNGETRRRNKRSCGKYILRAMYARDTLEQAYPGKYPWWDLCKIYIYIQLYAPHNFICA